MQEHQAFQRISARTTECHQRGPCSATISGIGSSQEPTPKGSIAVDAEAVAGADASRRDASGQADPKAGSAAHRTTLPRNRHFQRIMRTNLASEGAAAEMLGRRSKWAGTRPDLEYYKVPARCPQVLIFCSIPAGGKVGCGQASHAAHQLPRTLGIMLSVKLEHHLHHQYRLPVAVLVMKRASSH